MVAVRNHASRRAFEAAGFQTLPQTRHLMRCKVAGAAARPPVPGMDAIRELTGEADAGGLLQLAPALPHTVQEVTRLANAGSTTILVSERDGGISAFAELVKVRTLLYAGVWVEMLVISHPDEATSLIAAAVEQAKAEGLDEIGSLVTARDWRLRQAFASEGFVSAGEYLVMIHTVA